MGHHDTPVFQTLVDKFIEKYVLCSNCSLPEIDMVVNKRGLIVATCKACGWNGELDNAHKLATYISKNPPGTGIGFDEDKGGKKEKKDKAQDDDEVKENKEKKEKQEKKSKKEKKD